MNKIPLGCNLNRLVSQSIKPYTLWLKCDSVFLVGHSDTKWKRPWNSSFYEFDLSLTKKKIKKWTLSGHFM